MKKSELKFEKTSLPANIKELSRFVLVGREKLTAVRAEIRAIDKVGLARQVREQKLQEAQDLSEAVLDAEVKLGELIAAIPETPGKRTDLQPVDSSVHRSKKEVLEDAGFTVKQGQRFETLAAHPDIVAEMKAEARDREEIISRTAVLNAIAEQKKPYIINNSGDSEWYTPERYIESARKVMGSIDLDPASCTVVNETVKARKYYTIEDNGLAHEWAGKIWLNPPYSDVQKFVAKLIECRDNIDQAIVLVNNATETQWFRDLTSIASAIVFHTGRLRFIKPGQGLSAPMQGQAFIYIGVKPEEFLAEFSQYGWGAMPK